MSTASGAASRGGEPPLRPTHYSARHQLPRSQADSSHSRGAFLMTAPEVSNAQPKSGPQPTANRRGRNHGRPDDKARNKIDDLGGKAKEGLGKVTGDKNTQNVGTVDQAKSSRRMKPAPTGSYPVI